MADSTQTANVARAQGRTLYLDLLRVIASILVVIIHVNSANYYRTDIAGSTFLIFNFFAQYAHVAVPIFVMISGALFLDERRNVTYTKILRRNVPHVAVPFLFWSTAYAIVFPVSAKSTIGMLVNTLAAILKGSQYFLWFLPMIIGLYLVTPLLRSFTKDEDLERAFLLLGFVFAVCIPTIIKLGGLSDSKSVATLIGGLRELVNRTHFCFALEYPLYYVLGHYLSRNDLKVPRAVIALVGAVALGLGSWLSFYQSNFIGKASSSFHDNFILTIFIGTCAVFILAKSVLVDKWPAKAQSTLLAWSGNTFGIYLVHIFFIRTLGKMGINSLMCNALIAVPATSALVYLLSFVTAWLIGRIPVLGKWVV